MTQCGVFFLDKNDIMEENGKGQIYYARVSKNRTKESFNGRGMYKKITRNIEHDIPHQVYFTQFILGDTKETKLLLQE